MNRISILVSPDGYEMVIPLFDKDFAKIGSFVGVDTARIYELAKVRHDQEADSVKTRLLQMSNWRYIVHWFAVNDDQVERVSSAAVNWMLGTASRLHAGGSENDDLVSLEDANNAIMEG